MSAFNASNTLVSVWTGSPTPVKKTVARQTDLSFERSKTSIDISSKTSSRYGEKLSGGKNGKITFDAFIETAPGSNEVSEAEMDAIYESDNAYKYTLASAITGTISRDVYAIMTDFNLKYTKDTGAIFSVTLEITGAPTNTVVA